MIVERVDEYRRSRIKQWPQNNNRASTLGHECLRFLVFERTRWQEKALHGVKLQAIFDEGHVHEAAVFDLLRRAGITIIEQQRPFSWPEHEITGHIDGKIKLDGKLIPIEIKSASAYSFQSINSPTDLYNGKYHYQRMYPAQITLYCLMDNKEEGLILFKNKQTGELKEIMMPLDYDLGERLIQKADAINRHVTENTTPDCMPYDEMVCGECGYLHICLPEIKREAISFEDRPGFLAKLNRRGELAPLAKEYERLDKEIKNGIPPDKDRVVAGDWLITRKLVHKKSYTVPEQEYLQTKIQLLGKGDSDE